MTEKQKLRKRRDALSLLFESLHNPDHELMQCANDQKCFNELMEWRRDVLKYLIQRWKDEFDD